MAITKYNSDDLRKAVDRLKAGSIWPEDIEAIIQAADALERENKEIDELKKQVSIAKDVFFNIAQRKHSREVHDIVCEAEFMMNHPECRNEVTNV